MDFELFAQIILLAINALGFVLVWWVIHGGNSKQLKFWFTMMAFFVLMWSNFSYLGSKSISINNSVLLYRLNWASVSLFLTSFYNFFIVYFLKAGKFAKRLGYVILLLSVALFLMSLFTDLIIEDVVRLDWGNAIVFGNLAIFFNLFAAFVAISIVVYSLKSYRSLSKDMKIKLQYFLVGVFVFVSANLIFNVISQVLFQSVKYQIFGDFSAIFLLCFTAYAIVKHNLFDVRIFATEALTVIIWIILFSKLFVSQDLAETLVDTLVLLVTIIFGIFLIRSVKNEIKQRQQLEDLTEKLKKLDAQKDEFVNVAAHELRAPMTAIKGYISMVLEGDAGKVSSEALEYLADASSSNDRLIRLVNNMLNMNRIEEGRMVFKMGNVKLSDVARKIFSEHEYVAKDKKLDYKLEISNNLSDTVYVDEDRIFEVVSNLINNAIKYTDKGYVEVKLYNPSSSTVKLEVNDSGPGISDQDKKKLFQKFQRAESSAGKVIGSGLGLYITKLLINKFKGKVGMESELGKGSTFWIELPIIRKES